MLSIMFVGAAAVAYFVVASWRRPRPAAFVVAEGRGFVVPPGRLSGHLVVVQAVMFGFLASHAIDAWTRDDSLGGYLDTTLNWSMTVMAVLGGMVVAGLLVAVLRGRPRIELTPSGLIVREVAGSRTIPWEALRPGTPERQANWAWVVLTIDRPELIVWSGLNLWGSKRVPKVQTLFLAVHPWFLADAIRHYRDHPDHRGALGNRAEYDRLLAELAG